jgi:hypothetical protein
MTLSTKSEREALLAIAEQAQQDFWVALRNLELAYGEDAEIDGTAELTADIDDLDAEMRDAGYHVVDVICPGE